MLYGTTTTLFHLAMCYAVPRLKPFSWQCVMRYHDQCNLAMCHTVAQPVYFTWQCVMRYHNQCISPNNVSYCTTTSDFDLAMCHAYHDQCNLAICHRYHNQFISYGNVAYGTTTSAFRLAVCHAVSRPLYFTWQCVMRYHNQCLY